ncbi:kinase-like domain-containing protein [Gigaspora rosea]|uniref:Kinase-like domain-containing protein n=1 Tax=Gigaspora rosea TaxID=44941 RepID=A0A397W086_9GLOM|nr:kinase-like domain-containing protein [Gigaspora rosea]
MTGMKMKKSLFTLEYFGPQKVVLKYLNGSNDNLEKTFFNEAINYYKIQSNLVVYCHRITKSLENRNYIIVMNRHPKGNLRSFLKINHPTLNLTEFQYLGFCGPVDEKSSREVYRIIPYIAPEVFEGKKHTKESDIYSIGILLWEIFSEIMQKCWDANSFKRPTIEKLCKFANDEFVNAYKVSKPDDIVPISSNYNLEMTSKYPLSCLSSRILSGIIPKSIRNSSHMISQYNLILPDENMNYNDDVLQ